MVSTVQMIESALKIITRHTNSRPRLHKSEYVEKRRK